MIFARKIKEIRQIPEFHMIFFPRKMPEFYIIIARKNIFPNFGGHVPPAPVSYAYVWTLELPVASYLRWY